MGPVHDRLKAKDIPPHSQPYQVRLVGLGYASAMESSEYPARRCREAVFNLVGMAYVCELPSLHLGPHASQSVRDSVTFRETWEVDNPASARRSQPTDDIILDGPK